jgi:hypothetical protein
MRAIAGGETDLRGFGPRNRAEVFATREDAQREIDAVQERAFGLFKFEIQPE